LVALCLKRRYMGKITAKESIRLGKKMDFGTKGWCAWCKRPVKSGGVRYRGKLYHKRCLERAKKFYP
jgi:hypothetical protein